MLLQLPCVLIRKIIFNLEINEIYRILLTNTTLLNFNFQKFCIPQIFRNELICKTQDSNEVYELIKYFKNNINYSLGQYLNDLIDIIDSNIYYNQRDKKYSVFNKSFKFKKTVNFIYNKINFDKIKNPKYSKIHNVYRINYFTYLQLKKKHLNILALIY